MVLDTSALLAVLFDEPERESVIESIAAGGRCLVSAPTLVETGIVVEARKGKLGSLHLDLFVHEAGIEIVPFSEVHAEAARKAWRDFGRGRHEANLNYGDCFTYALAKVSGEPLLHKGGDFGRTDLETFGSEG